MSPARVPRQPRHRATTPSPAARVAAVAKPALTTTGSLAVVAAASVAMASPAAAQVPRSAAPSKPTTGSTQAVVPAQSAAPTPGSTTVTVARGDTVSRIAARAGVSTESVLRANSLRVDSLIFPGQHLTVPSPGSSATAAPSGGPVAAPATEGTVGAVLALARAQTGIAYAYGEETPGAGFDCSGLVQYVYGNAAGVRTPRTVAALRSFGTRVSASEARPGDLVLFNDYNHVAIYAGNGMIIDAPRTGTVVSERKLWTSEVVYRRVL